MILEIPHHAIPESRRQHDLRPRPLPEFLPDQIVIAAEILDLDPDAREEHLEEFREVEGPERSAGDETDFVLGGGLGFGGEGVLGDGSARVQNPFWRPRGAGGEEDDAGTFFRHGEGWVEGVACQWK